MSSLQKVLRIFRQDSRGFGLIEATIAMGLLGVIAVCFLVALATSYKVVVLADEQVTAKSLARSQMEYIEQQEYILAPDGGEVTYLKIDSADIPEGYAIFSVDRSDMVTDSIKGIPWDPDPSIDLPADSDQSLQKIALIVKYDGTESLTLEGFKVKQQ